MSERIVIVGGGLAAATAAEQLRSRGYTGALDLVAAEQHRPYQRPPLSKAYLTGRGSVDEVFVHADGWEHDHDIALHTGAAAERVDDHAVRLADGRTLGFDRLLIATGAQPRRLDLQGSDAVGVHTFRTIDDSEALRGALVDGGRQVVFIGAGWIGLELAAAARTMGNHVTVLAVESVPLSAALGAEMGRMFLGLHQEHGVDFRLEAHIEGMERDSDNRVTGVRVDGAVVPADIVVVGVGAAPDTSLAKTAGLELDNGILVDERLVTSSPDVVAAGDVANPIHPFLGTRLRSEHWANAIAGGKVAASTLMDGDAVLDDIPYFYTDQYDLGMEYCGFGPLARDAELIVRGDLATRSFIAFWVSDARIVAGMNVNVWDVNDSIQDLIRGRVIVDRERLADPTVDLARVGVTADDDTADRLP
jgi:3-phenylpropionate/trans-cinnamate dioxygenase ferredoxin reductase component